jgi:hypothetical protein
MLLVKSVASKKYFPEIVNIFFAIDGINKFPAEVKSGFI